MVPTGNLDGAASTIQAFSDAYLNRLLDVAAFTLLYYDYVLMLPLEVERLWKDGHHTWMRSLYFVIRYVALLEHISVFLQVFQEQQSLILAHQIYLVISQGLIGIVLLIRTYALYNSNRPVKWFLILVSVILIAIACWSLSLKRNDTVVQPPGIGKARALALSESQAKSFALAWSGMLLFDFSIFVLTLVKAVSIGSSRHRTLFDTILRDGTMYFGVMTVTSLCTILTLALGRPFIRGVPSTLTNIVSTTLICRFVLNLRNPNLTHPVPHTISDSLPVTTTMDLTAPNITSAFPITDSFEDGCVAIRHHDDDDEEDDWDEWQREHEHDVIELVPRSPSCPSPKRLDTFKSRLII